MPTHYEQNELLLAALVHQRARAIFEQRAGLDMEPGEKREDFWQQNVSTYTVLAAGELRQVADTLRNCSFEVT